MVDGILHFSESQMDLPETQARRLDTGPSGVQRGLEDPGISVLRGGPGTGHPEANETLQRRRALGFVYIKASVVPDYERFEEFQRQLATVNSPSAKTA